MNAHVFWLAALAVVLAAAPGERAMAQEQVKDVIVPALEAGTPPPAERPVVTPRVLAPPPSSGETRETGETQETGREPGANPSAGAPGSQPAGGAPGRQHSPLPAAPVEPAAVPLLTEEEAVVLRQFECPRDAIGRMLESAVSGTEFSASLALEREVLELCRDRQGVLAELVASDRLLAEVLRKDRDARAAEAAEAEAERQRRAAEVEAAQVVLQRERDAARHAEAARAAAAAAPAAEPEPETDYGWYTVIGRGDDLRAGVTDGETRMFVRVGDNLPGGIVVTAIERAPAGVRVRGASVDRLPYRPLGGG